MKPEFIGVGVGPGDPGLITLKAADLILNADVVGYIATENGRSQAREIAEQLLSQRALIGTAKADDIKLLMPMSEDRQRANQVYDDGAAQIVRAVSEGLQVVFLCEGDPLFFGSFGYLLQRLKSKVVCQVVPGISSVHAAASALQHPLTEQQESFAVVSGRHSLAELCQTLLQHDSVVIMKAGRSRQRILDALQQTGRTDDARYLEYISREQQQIVDDISDLDGESGPYFSLFVVTRQRQELTL